VPLGVQEAWTVGQEERAIAEDEHDGEEQAHLERAGKEPPTAPLSPSPPPAGPVPIPYPSVDARVVETAGTKDSLSDLQHEQHRVLQAAADRAAAQEDAASAMEDSHSEVSSAIPANLDADIDPPARETGELESLASDPAAEPSVDIQAGDLSSRGAGFVSEMAAGGGAVDPNALVQEVLRESYQQTTEDLKAMMQEVEEINEEKAAWRDVQDEVNASSVLGLDDAPGEDPPGSAISRDVEGVEDEGSSSGDDDSGDPQRPVAEKC